MSTRSSKEKNYLKKPQKVKQENKKIKELINCTSLNNALLKNSNEGICILDENLDIVNANSKLLDLFKFTFQEIQHKSIFKLIGNEKLIQEFLRQKEFPQQQELLITQKNGTSLWAQVSISPLLNEDEYAGSLIMFQDISHLKDTEEKLNEHTNQQRENYRQMSLILNRMPIACMITDEDFNFTYWNPSAEKIFGYKFDEVKDKHPADLIFDKSAKNFLEKLFNKIKEGDLNTSGIGNNITKDGKKIICEWFNTPLSNADGKYTGLISLCQDITSRTRNERLLAIQKEIMEMIALGKEESEILDSLVKLMEKESGEALCSILRLDDKSKNLMWAAAPSLAEEYNEEINGLLVGEYQGSCGTAAHRKSKVVVTSISEDPLWEHARDLALKHGLKACTSVPIFGKENQVLGTFAFYYTEERAPSDYDYLLMDASSALAGIVIERHQILKALKQSEELHRHITENLDNLIRISDAQGNIFYVSPAVEKVTGMKPEKYKKLNVINVDLVHQEDVPLVKQAFQELEGSHTSSELVYRIKRTDGSIRWIESWNKRLNNNYSGNILSLEKDITEKKEAEEIQKRLTNELVRQNKDLQQFSYITSHNLRSPVSNILGLTNIFNFNNPSDPRNGMLLKNLQIAAKNLDKVIKDLNQITSQRNLKENKHKVDFDELINIVEASLEKQIESSNAQIITDFEKAPSIVTILSYVQSIFTNLIENAIKYRHPDRKLVIKINAYKVGKSTFVKICDNGLGIDLEKNKDKIFGLYKRFHSHVGGKGMGLHLVKTQIETLGGSLEVQSEVNKGTCFTICFNHYGKYS